MTAVASPLAIDRVARPLDLARNRLMHAVLKTRLGVFVVARRDRRVAAQAAVGVVVTFLLVAIAPAFMLAVAPIVFGVPHVASDVRYLVLRRGVSRSAIVVTLAFAALVTALRAAELCAPAILPWANVEMAALFAWVASAAIAGARGSFSKAAPVLLIAGAFAIFAVPHATGARIILAHAHNFIAIAVWLFVFRRNVRAATLPLILAGGAVILLFSGVTLPISTAHASAFGSSLADAATWLAPGFSVRAGIAIVLAFAFMQSMHYAVWLGWIPQEDIAAEGTLSFKMSMRSIVRDFGPRGVALVVALSAIVLLGAFVAMARTRELYLSLATFHGYLEIAMLAYFSVSMPQKMNPALAWGRAFAVTLIVEEAVVLAMTRDLEAPKRRAALIFFANLATHPAVWFVFPVLISHDVARIVASEAWAIILEAVFYGLTLRMRPARAFGVSAIANAISFGAGVLVRAVTGFV